MIVSIFLFVSDDESGEKSVSVLLAGEESELTFIDHPYSEISVSNTYPLFPYLYHRTPQP